METIPILEGETMGQKKATLSEVAALAGVSLGSASRAMRGSGASGATVQRVREAAKELGYVPNSRAKALREGRTMSIAFAVPDVGNPVYVEMLAAITEILSPVGYRVTITPVGNDIRTAVDLVHSFANGSVDGVIMSTVKTSDELIQALNLCPVPVIIIGQPVENGHFETVTTDSGVGIGLAVRHVVERGCDNLIFVNGPLDTRPGAARQYGFDEAVESLGAKVKSARTIRVGDFTLDDGTQAGRRIARLWGDTEFPKGSRSIIAANDLLAIGVIRELILAGLEIPRDVAVTGMDAIELGKVTTPTLTSVSLRAADRGRIAAESLLSRLDHPDQEPSSTFIEPELVIAESTGWM